jgi:hypothetical protein
MDTTFLMNEQHLGDDWCRSCHPNDWGVYPT